jgi:hypothetical protein
LETDVFANLAENQRTADEETAILSNDVRAFNFTGIRQLTCDGSKNVGHGKNTDELTEPRR